MTTWYQTILRTETDSSHEARPLEISASWLCRSFHCLIIRKFTNLWDFSFAHYCCCCCSVTQSCLTLCDPRYCSGLLCPPLFPRVCSNSCLLSQWCYLTISSSVVTFSFCLLSCPASVFAVEIILCMRWPRYWSLSFSISPSTEYSGLISFRIDWFDFLVI